MANDRFGKQPSGVKEIQEKTHTTPRCDYTSSSNKIKVNFAQKHVDLAQFLQAFMAAAYHFHAFATTPYAIVWSNFANVAQKIEIYCNLQTLWGIHRPAVMRDTRKIFARIQIDKLSVLKHN